MVEDMTHFLHRSEGLRVGNSADLRGGKHRERESLEGTRRRDSSLTFLPIAEVLSIGNSQSGSLDTEELLIGRLIKC